MGIQGLLPLLKEIHNPCHISDFKGQTLAVDAYVWLHRGAFTCAPELVKGQRPTRFVDYAMERVQLLLHHGITPYIVFDGGPLPAKKGTEVDRSKKREEALGKAEALQAQGRRKEARDAYAKCVDVTPEMALQWIKALRAKGIDYVVAPYEADAQLAYLERNGIVDGIITEDSDLLVFGCKNVVYKLDSSGSCINIQQENLGMCKEFPFIHWKSEDFRRMAILAGCDYLDSLPGIGLKTAHKLLRKHKTVEKLIRNVRLEGNILVPRDYIDQFNLAELVFLHQRVYCPREKRLVTLLPLPEEGLGKIECGYIGPDMLPEIAHGIAIGDLHPETQLKLDDNWPHYQPQAGPSRPTPKVATTSTSSFYRQSTPLGNSATKINKSGPLDSFFSRTPTSRGTGGSPSMFLPKPVGFHRSGPARISDLVGRSKSQLTGSPACHYQPSPIISGASTSKPAESKFFAKFKMASVPVRSQVEIFHDPPPADILLEDLGEACGDQKDKEVEDEDCPLTSPVSISRARSPSPICSALSSPENSPEKKHTFSSPLKGFSILSKRASDLSSPVSMRKRFKRNSEGLAGEGKEGLDLACSSISSPFGEAETGTAVDAKKVEELPTFAATDPFISASTSEHIERKQSVFHASPSLHGQPIDNRDHKGMRHYPIKNELSFSSSPPGFDPKPSQHRSSDVHAHASQIPRTPDDIEEVSDDEEEDILSPRKKRNSSATVGVMHTESVKKVAQGWREKYSFGGIQKATPLSSRPPRPSTSSNTKTMQPPPASHRLPSNTTPNPAPDNFALENTPRAARIGFDRFDSFHAPGSGSESRVKLPASNSKIEGSSKQAHAETPRMIMNKKSRTPLSAIPLMRLNWVQKGSHGSEEEEHEVSIQNREYPTCPAEQRQGQVESKIAPRRAAPPLSISSSPIPGASSSPPSISRSAVRAEATATATATADVSSKRKLEAFRFKGLVPSSSPTSMSMSIEEFRI